MIDHLKELYGSRELLVAFTKREIKIRYKQTSLGAMWAILQPFSLMLIFSLVFGLFLNLESDGIPHPIFYYSALLSWIFFSTSVAFGSLSIVANANLVSKVYFPRETLPLASVAAATMDLIIASVIFILMMVYYHIPLTVNLLYALPVIVILVTFTLAIVLISSALVVIWRDLKFVVPLTIQIGMFATPIIYPVSKVPENIRSFYMLNPMAVVIDNFRSITISAATPIWSDLLKAFMISVILLIIGYTFFKKKEKIFADII